MQAWIRSI